MLPHLQIGELLLHLLRQCSIVGSPTRLRSWFTSACTGLKGCTAPSSLSMSPWCCVDVDAPLREPQVGLVHHVLRVSAGALERAGQPGRS